MQLALVMQRDLTIVSISLAPAGLKIGQIVLEQVGDGHFLLLEVPHAVITA